MLENIVIISLLCFGLKVATMEGMILHTIYAWLEERIGHKTIRDPLINCIYCMSSFWSIMFYVLTRQSITITSMGITILAVCGLNYILRYLAPVEK